MSNQLLAEPLGIKEWNQKLQSLQEPLSFADLVELAKTSPALRIAFDTTWQTGMNRESKISYYKQEIFKLHGINPYFSETLVEPSSAHTLESVIDESQTDADVWDALSYAVSEIVRDGLPIEPTSRDWASEVIGGRRTRPKVRSGPHPLKHSARDLMVVYFLSELTRFRAPISENEATFRGQSACHAISEALSGYYTVPSPKTLMNIWSNRSQNWKTINGNE